MKLSEVWADVILFGVKPCNFVSSENEFGCCHVITDRCSYAAFFGLNLSQVTWHIHGHNSEFCTIFLNSCNKSQCASEWARSSELQVKNDAAAARNLRFTFIEALIHMSTCRSISVSCDLATAVRFQRQKNNYSTLHYIQLHYITFHSITLHDMTWHYITSIRTTVWIDSMAMQSGK